MSKDFWKNYKKPIFALAPMDGYTDSAFRRICREVSSEVVVYTEFTSVEGLSCGAQRIKDRFSFHPCEKPVIAQVFGHDIPSYVYAAKYLETLGFTGIDINMGCPSKKIVKSECGIALRKNHSQAWKIIEAVANATRLPVSVKTRLGWSDHSDLEAFARGAQNSGANLIAVHARTYLQPYGCPANFEPLYRLKETLRIPILGNGGIASLRDGREKLGNLDGFMIGQASWGNPWVFQERKNIEFSEKVPVIKRHARYLVELRGEKFGVREMRKHLLHYIRSIPNASKYRIRFASVEKLDEIFSLLNSVNDEVLFQKNNAPVCGFATI